MLVETSRDLTTVVESPGQGNQRVGMGNRLAERSKAARRVWIRADDALYSYLGEKLSDIVWRGSDEQLQDTRIAQPAIVVDSLARKAAADEIGVLGNPEWIAYLSLGSATSLVISGALTLEAAAYLTIGRGEAFNLSIKGHPPTTMVALVGIDEETRTEVAEKHHLELDLDNSDEEKVMGGLVPDVEAAITELNGMGFGDRYVFSLRKRVAAAFHSKFMLPAQERWEQVVDSTPFEAPKYGRIVGGTTVTILDTVEAIRRELKLQLTNRERYREVVRFLYSLGVRRFKELNEFRRLTSMNIDMLGIESQKRMLYPPKVEGEKDIIIGHELVVP